MGYFPETPDGQGSRRQFQVGIGLLVYALAVTVWPNLIWVVVVALTMFVPVITIVALFFGRGVIKTAIWYLRALVRGE